MLKYFGVLLLLSACASMLYAITSQEKKCIDGQVHNLKANEYWQATGFHCTPLSSEETLDE